MTLPKPYYEDTRAGITIYNGDNNEIIPYLESVDMVLTSPPYDDLRQYGGKAWDFERTAKLLFENMKDGSSLVWIVGDKSEDGNESGTSFKQALFFKEIGFKLNDTMIYAKDGCPSPHVGRYFQCFEYMFVFVKGDLRTFNPLLDRKNRNMIQGPHTRREKNDILTVRKKVEAREYGLRRNIWEYSPGYMKSAKESYVFEHPAVFPEDLAKDHISTWSNPGDTVLDCFAGSGTTIKVAKELGRKAIGIEIESRYCDIAVKRLRQEVLPLDI